MEINLRLILAKKRITQAELGRKVLPDEKQTTVNHHINGLCKKKSKDTVRLSLLFNICKELDVTATELLGF